MNYCNPDRYISVCSSTYSWKNTGIVIRMVFTGWTWQILSVSQWIPTHIRVGSNAWIPGIARFGIDPYPSSEAHHLCSDLILLRISPFSEFAPPCLKTLLPRIGWKEQLPEHRFLMLFGGQKLWVSLSFCLNSNYISDLLISTHTHTINIIYSPFFPQISPSI